MARITESQLILPALFLISLTPAKRITTDDLIPKLRDILKPTGTDTHIIAGRRDDYFSQKVRNLKSHNTLERHGFATYDNGWFTLTDAGTHFLGQNMDKLRYLLANDFQWEDVKAGLDVVSQQRRTIETFDEDVTIQEGVKKVIAQKVYERSARLRAIAIEHYRCQGKISCKACSFNFNDFYGAEIGREYIEIHHVKPIFMYQGDDLNRTIDAALANVAPLCSNCHRMIHRDWRNPLHIDSLIATIQANGVFLQ